MPLLKETAPDNRLPCLVPTFNVLCILVSSPLKISTLYRIRENQYRDFISLKKKKLLEGTIHDRKMTSSTAHKIVL